MVLQINFNIIYEPSVILSNTETLFLMLGGRLILSAFETIWAWSYFSWNMWFLEHFLISKNMIASVVVVLVTEVNHVTWFAMALLELLRGASYSSRCMLYASCDISLDILFDNLARFVLKILLVSFLFSDHLLLQSS